MTGRFPLLFVSPVDHPANTNPTLVGAVGAVRFAAVATDPLATAVPPFESKVTVKVLAVHLARRVKFAVFGCAYGNVTKVAAVPLSASSAVDQPTKV